MLEPQMSGKSFPILCSISKYFFFFGEMKNKIMTGEPLSLIFET
jgi:hypothetical protein